MPNICAMSGICLCLCAWASQCASVHLDHSGICLVGYSDKTNNWPRTRLWFHPLPFVTLIWSLQKHLIIYINHCVLANVVEYRKRHLIELIKSAAPSKIGWPLMCLCIFLPEHHADAVSIVFQMAYFFLAA